MKILKLLQIPWLVFSLFFILQCQKPDGKADAYGNFEATEVTISSQSVGVIIRHLVDEGDDVSQNQLLALIDTTDLYLSSLQLKQSKKATESQLVQIQAQIEVQKQQLKNAQVNQRRIKSMYEDGAATAQQLDDIDGTVLLIEKQILATNSQKTSTQQQAMTIQKQIDQLDENIRKCRITSPIQGRVLQNYVEMGEVVTYGKPLFKVADLKILELKAYVSGDQLASFSLGQEVDVYYDQNQNELAQTRGIVSWVSENAEFTPKIIQTKQERVNLVYAIKIKVDNSSGQIKIGMPGEVRFN